MRCCICGTCDLYSFKRVAVDDRRIDSLEIQKIVYVFGGPAGYDRENLHVPAVIHDPSNLGREPNRRALQKAARQADRPGIEPLPDLRLFRAARRRPRVTQDPPRLSAAWIEKRKKHEENGSKSGESSHCDNLAKRLFSLKKDSNFW